MSALVRHFVTLALLAAACWTGAIGGERSHAVRSGESVSAIAKRYCGDHAASAMLLAYNGRDDAMLHPGETLRVPYPDEHVVRAGDSWSVLTRRYLGRTDAWRIVAELNGMPPESALRVGEKLRFPFVLPYRLGRGESLATVADRFYGDERRGELLREFNRIDDPRRLAVGQRIEVPLLEPRCRAAADRDGRSLESPAIVSVPPPGPQPPTTGERGEVQRPTSETVAPRAVQAPLRFAASLDSVQALWERGEFDEVRQRLEGLRSKVESTGAPAERIRLWRLLAFVYVAFDRQSDACDAVHALHAAGGDTRLDADLVSPKIRAAFDDCSRSSSGS